jgi:cyclophilin family peptidyl-prolyl cis-trans isomerase
VPVLRIFLTTTFLCAFGEAVAAQQAPPSAKGVTVTLACSRQSVAAPEAFPVRITVANDSQAPISFDRADAVSAKSFVAATYEKKGQWVTVHEPPGGGSVEVRPGESFTIPAKVTLPEALTKTPTALLVQWVGRGALDGHRSNEITVSVRDDPNPTATLETTEGTIVLALLAEKAPNHVANFITLARSGFYDGRIFHRVIPGFMVQTGCPLGTGFGDAGYKIPAEFSDTPFVKGTLGMARGEDHDSGSSQFFICVADNRSLDKSYTAFGRVLEGQDVADKISQVPRDTQKGDRPFKDVILKKVTIVTPAGYQLPEVKKVSAGTAAESRAESR